MATGLGTPNAAVLPAALCGQGRADPVSVTDPGDQRTHLDATVQPPVRATDSIAGQKLTYRAIGLPPGLSIDSTSGLIHGTPTPWGTYSAFVVRPGRRRVPAPRSASAGWSTWPSPAPTSATATIGKGFTFTVRATGVPNTYTVSPKPPVGPVVQAPEERDRHPVGDARPKRRPVGTDWRSRPCTGPKMAPQVASQPSR